MRAPSHRIAARSRTLRSSRTLPGQSYCSSASRASSVSAREGRPNDLPISWGGYWKGPGPNGADVGADAKALPLTVGGHPAYGIKARTCRYFLFRAVRFLTVEAGVRQFLDIGTGLPTAENTHEVAQRFAPESRIVYVDNDPLVLVHARALLTSTPEGVTEYIEADLNAQCIPQLYAATDAPNWGDVENNPWTSGLLVPYAIES